MEGSLTWGPSKVSGLAKAGQTKQLPGMLSTSPPRHWRPAWSAILGSLPQFSPTTPWTEPHPVSNNDCPGSRKYPDLQGQV